MSYLIVSTHVLSVFETAKKPNLQNRHQGLRFIWLPSLITLPPTQSLLYPNKHTQNALAFYEDITRPLKPLILLLHRCTKTSYYAEKVPFVCYNRKFLFKPSPSKGKSQISNIIGVQAYTKPWSKSHMAIRTCILFTGAARNFINQPNKSTHIWHNNDHLK